MCYVIIMVFSDLVNGIPSSIFISFSGHTDDEINDMIIRDYSIMSSSFIYELFSNSPLILLSFFGGFIMTNVHYPRFKIINN